MKRYSFNLVSIIVVIIFLIIPSVKSHAIPAFARKYQISCQVCHSPAIPRLKAFGDEFAGNGFRLKEYESPRYFIETGDEKLALLRELPIAVRFDGFASYNFSNGKTTDFGFPFGLKLMSGGELSDKLSYYFYFYMNERGEVAGVEDAFLMYHDLFNTGINIYAGQFQACDPLFKRELRYTLEDYKIYTVTPGNSIVSLKYERGFLIEKDILPGTGLVAAMVNGNGTGEASSGFLFDKDKYKNFMLKINQSIGEVVSIGLFGYTGKEVLSSTTGLFTNKIQFFGPDISLDFGEKVIIGFQYLRRVDSDVFIESTDTMYDDVITHGGFGEIIFSPRGDMSKWYLTGLVNLIDSELDYLDYTSATLHAGYLLRRNLRLVGEYTWQFSDDQHGRINAGFITAF